MSNTFFATLAPMLNMFLLIAAGYVLRKKNILPENSDTVLSKLETNLLVPAVSLYSTLSFGTLNTYLANLPTMFYASIAIVVSILLSVPISRVLNINDTYKKGVYKYAIAFANYGFMGNAIVPFVLGGDEHLFNYVLYTIPLSILTYTWGLSQLIPKAEGENQFKRLFNPTTIALLAGLFLSITGINNYIPRPIIDTVSLLKGCMGPVAMILTGYILAGYSVKSLLLDKKVYIATFLRLLIIPSFLIILLKLLRADNYTLTLTLFAFATPLGLNTVVFPASYGMDTKTGAGMAVISHTLSILTLPVIYSVFTYIFN